MRQQPQDIKLSHCWGQKLPHRMGTESNRPGTNACGHPTVAALSTPTIFVKVAPIIVHNTQ